MKLVTSDIALTLRGRFGNLVARPGSFVPVDGLKTTVSLAQYRSGVRQSVYQDNNRIAFNIIINAYKDLKSYPIALQTWIDRAAEYSIEYGYRITAYNLFMKYYSTKYNGRFGVQQRPVGLTSGSGYDWQNRESRIFV